MSNQISITEETLYKIVAEYLQEHHGLYVCGHFDVDAVIVQKDCLDKAIHVPVETTKGDSE